MTRAVRPMLTPSRIGDANRSAVLQALCDLGPLTRADLARLAGVPRATISGIVRPLLDSQMLEEGAPDRSVSRAGKPGRPLSFRSGAGPSIAISLRGDGIEAAVVSARGEILADHAAPLSDPADLRAVHRDIDIAVRAVAGSERSTLLGAGVAVPGLCDTVGGRVLGSSQIPALTDHALGPELEGMLGTRVAIDNDSRAQALGEKWFGDGRGFAHFAAIQTGHGLGVGLVMGGRVFRGEDGRVGEIGHIPVVPEGTLCACGLRGCWETVATLPWLRAEAHLAGLPNAATMDARALAVDPSSEARDLLERYADNLSLGLAILVQLVNPGRLILHGDAVGGGERLRAMVQTRTRERCLPHLADGLDVVLSTLDQRAGLLGAAGLMLSATFDLAT